MVASVLILVLMTFVGVLRALVRAVRGDGLGHRPPPPVRLGDERARSW